MPFFINHLLIHVQLIVSFIGITSGFLWQWRICTTDHHGEKCEMDLVKAQQLVQT